MSGHDGNLLLMYVCVLVVWVVFVKACQKGSYYQVFFLVLSFWRVRDNIACFVTFFGKKVQNNPLKKYTTLTNTGPLSGGRWRIAVTCPGKRTWWGNNNTSVDFRVPVECCIFCAVSTSLVVQQRSKVVLHTRRPSGSESRRIWFKKEKTDEPCSRPKNWMITRQQQRLW